MLNNKKSVELTKVFNYGEVEGVQIRTQVINNEPWFVARDVTNALGITWNGRTLDAIPVRWKGMVQLLTPGGTQSLTAISEAGLYKLAFRCQITNETADRFTNWVAEEVLPSIRKTGKYEAKPKMKLIPRAKSAEMAEFHDELTRWVTLEDERTVAELMNVGRRHVHKVLRGFSQSYGVLCMLVSCGKDNRKAGVRRIVTVRPRKEDMEQLRLEFMNDLEVEG